MDGGCVVFAACLSSVSLHLTSLVISVRLKTFDICQQSETQTRDGRKVKVNIFKRPYYTKFYLGIFFIIFFFFKISHSQRQKDKHI